MSFRKLTLDSGVWQWNAGRDYVNLISPQGKRTNPRISEILGHPQSDEPDQQYPVTPSLIKEYIIKLTS